MAKYIFIVGGVISGLGKGITAASISRLLMGHDLKVTNLKVDAYVNLDAGTMNPTEHGEVFVTDDGIETDQDIGNYERFIDHSLSHLNYATTGQIYQAVIQRERNLEYKGRCVEVVPHIPEEIINRIVNAGKNDEADIVIIEIGGTVGEYQNILFLEAARMMKYRFQKDVLTILVSYVPIPGTLGEMKTKPTQYASRTLNETGIQADFIICRGYKDLDEPRKRKIAILCNMQSWDDIISTPDVDNIYKVPLILKRQKLDQLILKKFGMLNSEGDLSQWEFLMNRIDNIEQTVKIGIVGKYFNTGSFVLADVYVSVIEAIKHGCWDVGVKPELTWLDSEDYEKNPDKLEELKQFQGIVIPGGFGLRGVDGIISSIRYLRENKIPFIGLCYGLQLGVIEFARNVCKMKEANTTEIDKNTPYPVINLMPEQIKKILGQQYGGTMRLGSYPCHLIENSLARKIYSADLIHERHRHRYEFNNEFKKKMEENGLVFSGINKDADLVEIIELPENIHPFFIAVQFHPEFKSRPLSPHPLFKNFAKACNNRNIPKIEIESPIIPQVLDPISIEIGDSLNKIFNSEENQNLLQKKFKAMKHIITDEMGIILPPIKIQYSNKIKNKSYNIKIKENIISSGQIKPEKFLAVAIEEKIKGLKGTKTYEPASKLPAIWISTVQRKKAIRQGCIVMNPEEVLISHCSSIIRENFHQLIGRQEVKALIDNLKNSYPVLVRETFNEGLKIGKLTKIIKNLIKEQIPVRDLTGILETIADNLEHTSDVEILTECVRSGLSRTITQKYFNKDNRIDAITLEPSLEEKMANSLHIGESGSFISLDPSLGHKLLNKLDNKLSTFVSKGVQPVLIVAPQIRKAFRRIIERPFPNLAILSWNEIAPEISINQVSTIKIN